MCQADDTACCVGKSTIATRYRIHRQKTVVLTGDTSLDDSLQVLNFTSFINTMVVNCLVMSSASTLDAVIKITAACTNMKID